MPGPFLNMGQFRTKITDTNTTQQEELGVWRFGDNGTILRYMKAGDILPRYTWVKVDTATASYPVLGTQVLPTSGTSDMVLGVSSNATIPKNSFGWITVYGPTTGSVVTNTTPGQVLGIGTTGLSGTLGVAFTTASVINAVAKVMAIQTGLSAGSAVFIFSL